MKILVRSICICWLFALPFCAVAQHIPNADSVLQRLPQLTGAGKVGALLDLCIAYLGKDKAKTIDYAKQAVSTAEQLQADSLIIRSLNYLSIAYLNHGETQLTIQTSQRAMELARRSGNGPQRLEAMSNLAAAYIRTYQNDKALPIAEEGIALAEAEQDNKSLVNFYEIVAEVQKDLKQWDAAEATYQKELTLVDGLGRPFEAARAYNNMGLLYAQRSKHREAVGLFEKARANFHRLGYISGEAIAMLNLSDALLGAGEFNKAGKAYQEVLQLNADVGEPEMEALATAGLGVVALSTGNPAAALEHLQKAEKIARESGFVEVLKDVYGYLEDLYAAKGDFPTAWDYREKSNLYADSVASQKVTNRVTELQVQYDTQKKETEIAQQRIQLVNQQSALFRQRTWLIGLLIGALALAVLGWLFHNRYRLRQKAELDAAVIREQQLGLNAVIEAQEAERRRIAKDLHDGIAQELVALKLGLTALQHQLAGGAPTEAAGRLGELTQQLDASCTEVRNIAHVMLPPALEQHGLAPSLEMLLRNTAQQAGIQVEFDAGNLPNRLDERMETGLYRIAQELLNNILKHAKAARVVLQLYTAGNNLILRMEDDGIGFDFEAVKKKGSMGMLNILSRVNTLGGVFFAEQREPQGTIATVRIPLA